MSSKTNEPKNDEQISNTDTPDADAQSESALFTDGGTEMQSHSDVQGSSGRVRTYSADGTLYAYRDGDEHVVVARGGKRNDEWTKRVTATREEVSEGDQLWTIPDNWEARIRSRAPGDRRYAIYAIPERDIDVEVALPRNVQVCDATYDIKRIGTIQYELTDVLEKDPVVDYLDQYANQMDRDIVDALETVVEQWDTFQSNYREEVRTVARRTATEQELDHDPLITLDHWTMELCRDVFSVKHLLSEMGIDDDVSEDVNQILRDNGAISSSPDVRLRVQRED